MEAASTTWAGSRGPESSKHGGPSVIRASLVSVASSAGTRGRAVPLASASGVRITAAGNHAHSHRSSTLRRVRVAIRCRPPLAEELRRDEREREMQRQLGEAAHTNPLSATTAADGTSYAALSTPHRRRAGASSDTLAGGLRLQRNGHQSSSRHGAGSTGLRSSLASSVASSAMTAALPMAPPPGWAPRETGVAVTVPVAADASGLATRSVYPADGLDISSPSSAPLVPGALMPVRVRNSNGAAHEWRFDQAFGPAATQDDVYDAVGGPVVAKVLDGYNGALLAYGQTGTGKSFTMGILDRVESESAGIIPRALSHLFGATQADSSAEYSMRLQFLQVYLDCVFDLLPADTSSSDVRPLHVREHTSRGFHVPSASEWTINSYEQAVDAVNAGLERRVLGATKMNATSSRSHTLLFVSVRKQSRTTAEVINGRLCLVDLAGSERVARTASTGARLDEARAINSSLAALGNVIAKLSDASKSAAASADVHVPFRDSKLTKLLSRSLGGQASTCVIATIGPMAIDRAETVSTLKFAERCMQVAARPVRHVARPGKRADDRLLLAESQWRAQTEQMRLEYETKLAHAQAAIRSSMLHTDAAVVAKAEALARKIIGATDGPGGRLSGAARLSELLDSAASAIEPLLAQKQTGHLPAGLPVGASTGSAGGGPQGAGGSADSGMDHQALLLRYLLEANEKLRAQGLQDPMALAGATRASSTPVRAHTPAERPREVTLRGTAAVTDHSSTTPHQQSVSVPVHTSLPIHQQLAQSSTSPVPDRIVASRTGASGAVLYRVRWMGAPEEEDEWFERSELAEDCPDLVQAFERR